MTKSNIEMAVSAALRQYGRNRMALAQGGAIDAKRCKAWDEYGYPTTIEFADFYRLFSRGGIAYGAVTKLAGRCWSSPPYITEGTERNEVDDVTEWEAEANLRIWRDFKEADIRRLVGRWSALILSASDRGEWHEPVTPGSRLVKVTPVWASALREGSDGVWHYKGEDKKEVKVHSDRIFILGRPSDIGFLEPVFNNFVNIEKVEGGSGESFLKNAARHLGINISDKVDLADLAATYGVPMDELQERYNEAVEDINAGLDTALITQGAEVSTITAPVSDPTPTYEINLQTISAGVDIPARILAMTQTGERASTEDQNYFNLRCEARCNTDLTDDIERFVEHCTTVGLLDPVIEYTVIWPSLTEPKKADKMAIAKSMAEIEIIVPGTFDSDEIRVAAGYIAHEDPLGEGY